MPGPRSRNLVDNMVIGEPRHGGSADIPTRSPARPRLEGGITEDQWRRAMMRDQGLPLPGGTTVDPRTMRLNDPPNPFLDPPGPRLPKVHDPGWYSPNPFADPPSPDNTHTRTKTPTDAQWLREHWRKGWENNPDKGITPGGPPSFDPRTRYKDYVGQAEDPFYGGGKPLRYGDWLRMQRWQNEVRAPHGYQTAEYRQEDSPEYWRKNKTDGVT